MRRNLDLHHLMTVFCAVVQNESFSVAASLLGIRTSSASKAVTQLESSLGLKLLVRTTRSMSLTEHGEYFYNECRTILDNIESVLTTLERRHKTPRGNFKLTATAAIGQFLLPHLIPLFLRQYPDITLELLLTDEILDIAANGIDVAIRSSEKISDSNLFSKQLACRQRVLVASPEYIQIYGLPHSPDDLKEHSGIIYKAAKAFDRWEMRKNRECARISMKRKMLCNSYLAVLQATRAGCGIARLFDYLVADDLHAGRLVELLGDYDHGKQNVFALYSHKREISPKLDAFLSFVESNSHLLSKSDSPPTRP